MPTLALLALKAAAPGSRRAGARPAAAGLAPPSRGPRRRSPGGPATIKIIRRRRVRIVIVRLCYDAI